MTSPEITATDSDPPPESPDTNISCTSILAFQDSLCTHRLGLYAYSAYIYSTYTLICTGFNLHICMYTYIYIYTHVVTFQTSENATGFQTRSLHSYRHRSLPTWIETLLSHSSWAATTEGWSLNPMPQGSL